MEIFLSFTLSLTAWSHNHVHMQGSLGMTKELSGQEWTHTLLVGQKPYQRLILWVYRVNFGKSCSPRKRGGKGGVRQRTRKLQSKNCIPLPSMILANAKILWNKNDELQGNVLHLCLSYGVYQNVANRDSSLDISDFQVHVCLAWSET